MGVSSGGVCQSCGSRDRDLDGFGRCAECQTEPREEYADQLSDRLLREMQAAGTAAMAQYARDNGLTAPPAHFTVTHAPGVVGYRQPKTIAALKVYLPDDRIVVVTTAVQSPRVWNGRPDVSGFHY